MLPIREKQMQEPCSLEGERRAKKMSLVSKGFRNCYFRWLLSPGAVSSLELHDPPCAAGWMVTSKRYVHLEPQNKILFGIVFVDVSKVKIWRWDPPGLRWALSPLAGVLLGDRKGEDRATQRRRRRQRLEWCWDRLGQGPPRAARQPPEAGRESSKDPPPSLPRERGLLTPGCQTSGLQTVRISSCCFKPPGLW